MRAAQSRRCLARRLSQTLAASGTAVQAQTQMQAQAQAPATAPEQVLVTGSLIRGTPAVGVPVSALTPQEFVETGQLFPSTDILKTIPALRIDAEASPTYGGGTLSFEQNVQIHGLGTGSGVETLLLINGLRWPPQNYSNDTVNPSIIPQIAIDRVDVLSAGASAVYGSDATAGVINIILKRGYDGAMTQAVVGASPDIGFLSAQFSQLFGKSWNSGNVTVSYSFTDSTPLSATKRSYYTLDFTPWGLFDDTPLGSSIPGIVHTGNAATTAGAPAGRNGCQRDQCSVPIASQFRRTRMASDLPMQPYKPIKASITSATLVAEQRCAAPAADQCDDRYF